MAMKNLKESTFIPDKTFPINIFFIREIHIHWHEHMEWIIVKEGKACIQVDDNFFELKKGEIAFVNSKQLHAACMLEPQTELIAIVFNEAIIRNSGLDHTETTYFYPFLNHHLKLPNCLKAGDGWTEDIVDSILNVIREFEEKENGYELFIKSELYRIFGLIFRHYAHLSKLAKPANKKHDFTILFDYLRENFREGISVDDAAKIVNLSPNHFCKVFKKLTGKTLIEYVNNLRISEADKLLTDSDLTITEIADKVGYGSVTYFGRVFKRLKSVSPTMIRKSKWKEQ